MKAIQISTKFTWKILTPTISADRFVGVCDRLGISTEGSDLDDLSCAINDVTHLLFVDLYETGDLNQFCFDRSIAYRIEESNKTVDITPSTIIIEGK